MVYLSIVVVDEKRAEFVEQEMGHSFTGIIKRNGSKGVSEAKEDTAGSESTW